jgi:Icc-related predicted phosphoesterase
MKLAFLTDIHGNLPALKVALKKIHSLQVDNIIIGGDIIGIGPFPAECVELLLSNPKVECILGNHEIAILDLVARLHLAKIENLSKISKNEAAHMRWVADQIPSELKSIIAQWPLSIFQEYENRKMYFCHYPIDVDTNDFFPLKTGAIQSSREENLHIIFRETLKERSPKIIGFGHDHVSFVHGHASFGSGHQSLEEPMFWNPGSLGCCASAFARFLVFTVTQNSYSVSQYTEPYDDSELFAAFETRNVPDRLNIYQGFLGNRFKTKEIEL